MKEMQTLIRKFNRLNPDRKAVLEAVTEGRLRYFVLITEKDGSTGEYAFETCRHFRYFMRGRCGNCPYPEEYFRV